MAPIKVDNVRQDKLVSNVLLARTNADMYLADIFLPTIRVKNDSGDIAQWGDAHMRSYDLKRSLHDTSLHYVEVEIGETIKYNISQFDVTHKVVNILVEQAEDPFNLFAQYAISAREIVKLNRDIALATQLTSTAVLTNNETLSGTDQWSDYTNSKPKTQIDSAIDSVELAIGKEANSIYFSKSVATKLRNHPDYINLYNGSNGTVPGGVPQTAFVQLMKDAHGFENVFIGKTVKITSKKGQAVTRDYVFGKDCVVFYRAAAPAIMEPSFGYSFVPSTGGLKTKTWFDEDSQLFYKVQAALPFDDKILMPDAAFLFKNAIA